MKPTEITKTEILKIYKPIENSAHKGTQGHSVIIGGSYGKMGSVCLASKASLMSGCGLVTGYIPKCGYNIMQTFLPEAMVITDINENTISKIRLGITPDAIGIGVGMGQDRQTKRALYQFLKNSTSPLVIDADALNILSLNREWLLELPKKTILTPHLKELERMIGKWESEEEKFEKTQALSQTLEVIIVMKGAPTYVFDGENVYKNTTGNPSLATAGSGDVLTGIITGLLAQSYKPLEASILGVYLHGLTADIALPETGHQAFIASTIIEYLGKAYLSFEREIGQG
ncbi:hydroxyethylthiazole kinase-like uncharacterized protein yjeF [Flavobacterium arsenatis]|uniref:ADP-dependent (S)-NAD(P)H-hydrate dehydratase n=1 Tax=Flavobacterium arsenatis TaxID=1484332 RepID=A0ABU1TQ19_9FLAO|nr:NAD(P)H-hydrate dehydratase [Flavobacterium arsenatis]MDR6968071.1 hydroxyethylthiazole kinase-like uncharacterized protein yjeF [Flavobacterium arsenatis]